MKFALPATVAALSLILSSCSTLESKPRDRFAEADLNHDGQLTHREIGHYLADRIFDSRDANRDGKLTMEEWNPTKNAPDTKAFKEADTNHDGYVTREEATTYAEKSGMVKKFVREADKNKDGKISRDEAVAYYASKEGSPR